MEHDNKESDSNLAQLESTAGKLTYVLSIMLTREEINQEEHDYLQMGILQEDPTFSLIIVLCKDKSKYDDICAIVHAQLQTIKPTQIEHAEDYSPNTHKKFDETQNDSSPLGNMLMYRKRAAEQKNDLGNFSLNIQ